MYEYYGHASAFYTLQWGGHTGSIVPPFVIILSSSQNPTLKRMTANACIFWSNTVSANNPSMAPPNAIRSGGAIELTMEWSWKHQRT